MNNFNPRTCREGAQLAPMQLNGALGTAEKKRQPRPTFISRKL